MLAINSGQYIIQSPPVRETAIKKLNNITPECSFSPEKFLLRYYILLMSHYSFLQCDTDCAKGDQDFQDTGEHTPHLLSHTFTGTNANRMREIVVTFMEEHLEDAYKLAKPWLDRKKTTFGDYKKFIKKKYSKFDELALMLFALGSKSHICVIFRDDTTWTTCESGSRDDCDIIFLYRGNLLL